MSGAGVLSAKKIRVVKITLRGRVNIVNTPLSHKHKQMKRKTNAEHCILIRLHPANVLHAVSILSLLFVGEGDAAVVPLLLIDLMICPFPILYCPVLIVL